jgi:hypothetical protein
MLKGPIRAWGTSPRMKIEEPARPRAEYVAARGRAGSSLPILFAKENKKACA